MLADLLRRYAWTDHPEGMRFCEIECDARRSLGHWLFEPGRISAFHRVTTSDELWLIHRGRLVLHVLGPAGESRRVALGADGAPGEVAAATVPAGHWQAAELPPGEPLAFGSNVCVPGFSWDALQIGRRADLLALYPAHGDIVLRLASE